MGKTAFLFAGQGAQYSGMGESLYHLGGAAQEVFELAEQLRPGTKADCFSGTAEQLSETEVTQPCVFAVDMAAACTLVEKGVKPQGVAGFSLGEVAALTFAGAFAHGGKSFAEGEADFQKNGFARGFEAVCERAKIMAEVGRESPASTVKKGAMCAILKLDDEQVKELCLRFGQEEGHGLFYPVNYNCPGQVVVAGLADDMAEFADRVKAERGVARVLPVSGAFHSPYMAEAWKLFGGYLQGLDLAVPGLPVYANLTAAPYADNVTDVLADQIQNPVRWTETIRNMGIDGFDTFIEVGPGKTLTGFVKRILPDAVFANVQDEESLNAVLAVLNS